MRALVLRDFCDLAVEERPDPTPGPREVLVQVTATGICGSDLHGFTGENGRRQPGQVMGHETVGVVAALGPGVDEPPPGTVVTVNPVLGCGRCAGCRVGEQQRCPNKAVLGVHPDISAAFAELMVAPAANVVALPDLARREQGALVEPLAVGYHATRRGGCAATDAVLVVGGGPIGQACVLAARRLGVERVAVSEPDPHRRHLASRLGAAPLDPGSGDVAAEASVALDGRPTLVLDAVGSTTTITDALACTATGGRVVLVGMAAPRLELPAYAVSTEERTVVGSFCYTAAEFADTARWVAAGPAELATLIEGRVDLDEAPEAFTRLANGESEASKVLVFPRGLPGGAAA